MSASDLIGLRARARVRWLACALVTFGLVACGDDDGEPRLDAGGDGDGDGDAGGLHGDGDGDGDGDAGVDGGPLTLGGLTVNSTPEAQELELFEYPGHRFWLEVSYDQLLQLNVQQTEEDIYTPGGGSGATYADHVLVQDVVYETVADYGKIEIELVGESTYRQWDRGRIPNIRFDTNEFDQEMRIGTFEHFRLNNSLVGSIFRESLAHKIYRALDYPALRSSHAFLGSNVWGDDVWVPMTLMEMYKRRFCRDNEELLGGTCENMWEFPGDLGNGNGGGGFPGPGFPEPRPIDKPGGGAADIIIPDPGPGPGPGDGDGDGDERVPESYCQVSECDDTALLAVMDVLAVTPPGAGFKDALDPYIDWQRYHEFQCMSWIMWTGDDPVHGGNNNLIIERDTDHKLIWAPYSVDISAGQTWYLNAPLTGTTMIPVGCQRDPECWADTITTCEDMIIRFDELNPEEMVDDMVTTLTDLDMMRFGDDERAEEVRQWYVWRQSVLSDELERWRFLPDGNNQCPEGLELCADETCGTADQCFERRCTFGQEFCESTQLCYDPNFEACPDCEEATPYFCNANQTCVEDVKACAAVCEQNGLVWCESVNDCVPADSCFDDSDGGVEPFPEPLPR